MTVTTFIHFFFLVWKRDCTKIMGFKVFGVSFHFPGFFFSFFFFDFFCLLFFVGYHTHLSHLCIILGNWDTGGYIHYI